MEAIKEGTRTDLGARMKLDKSHTKENPVEVGQRLPEADQSHIVLNTPKIISIH